VKQLAAEERQVRREIRQTDAEGRDDHERDELQPQARHCEIDGHASL
jgi:hypothetical protein